MPNTDTSEFVHSLESTNHTISVSLNAERLQKLTHASRDDLVLWKLRTTILQGWPENKAEVHEYLLPYYDFRDELVSQDDLIFKGDQIVIPAEMRKEMIASVHTTHIGIEGSIRKARDSMFWPRIATEL